MSKITLPTLCVVAGPNGSGKTTTTEQLLANEWASDSLYINPDTIAQDRFGDWNSQEAVLKAAQFATAQRYECLEKKKDFVFETVFSSVHRVTKRFLEGGHEVPISKIISRYYKSLSNAAQAIKFVDRTYLYDNSVEDEAPKLLLRTVDGRLFRQYEEQLPRWAGAVIEMLH